MKTSDDETIKDDDSKDKSQNTEESDISHLTNGSFDSNQFILNNFDSSKYINIVDNNPVHLDESYASLSLSDKTILPNINTQSTKFVSTNGFSDKLGLTIYGGDKTLNVGNLELEKSPTLIDVGFLLEAKKNDIDVLNSLSNGVLVTPSSPIFPLTATELKVVEKKYLTEEEADEKIKKAVKVALKENKTIEDENNYFFDGKTLKIKSGDGRIIPINFSPTQRRGTDPYFLCLAMVSILKLKGNRESENWFYADISMNDIINWLRTEFHMQIDQIWLKNTKSNLKRVIPTELLNSFISLGDYDRLRKCYRFGIKLPN